jgi:hypothetical protein
MHVVKWITIIATAVVVVPLLTTITLWIASLPIWQFERDNCGFNTVSNRQYRDMLGQAKRQRWTVWPGLSDGVFWPSDRGFRLPGPQFEQVLGQRLREAVDDLAGDHSSADVQLAAAHALMRSLGANLVSVSEVPPFPEAGQPHARVYFRYFLPQRRFAPLCLTCLVWRYTTIAVSFEHDLAANAYQFDGITVLHGDLKYGSRSDQGTQRQRNVSGFSGIKRKVGSGAWPEFILRAWGINTRYFHLHLFRFWHF